MNILLWVLQILLAVHTAIGAIWKFSNPAASVPSLSAIPHGVWLSLSIIELLCALGLLLPAIKKPLGKLVPISAMIIAAEMLIFCGIHIASGDADSSPMIYWLVVAAVCAFIAYGRTKLKPL